MSLMSRALSRPKPAARSAPSELLAARIVEHAQDGVLIADVSQADARIVYVNRAFETITGYSREEAVGKNCRYLQGSDRLQPEIDVMRRALAAGEAAHVQLRNYRKNGQRFWNALSLVPIGDPGGPPTYYVGFIRDVTEQVEMAAKLEEVTHKDQLTGCLNRDTLVQQLSLRTPASRTLLIKLDIARFHDINSGYGYDVGDALLCATAQRLASLGADMVARVGPDQFALVFLIEDATDPATVLERVTRSLAPRFALPGADIKVRFAIGFVDGAPGADATTLLRHAGAALPDSKASPLRPPCEFAAERQAMAQNRLQMTAELQRALAATEFDYHYQPQIDLLSGAIVGAEALLRWRHPLFGVQPPARFMGLAEETGLILDIGAGGLREVARFAGLINQNRPQPLRFSFNISSIELTHRDTAALVRNVIRETGIDPAWLTLELTESLLVEDSSDMLAILHRLRDLGVGLSVDDFGTGYSSLRYLERFPITEIKIDRSFVSGLNESAAKRVIVESVIRLGAALGVQIVGEGVERSAERDLLAAMGCPVVQGHLFGAPMAGDEFHKLVQAAP